jgi:hypothetical protein
LVLGKIAHPELAAKHHQTGPNMKGADDKAEKHVFFRLSPTHQHNPLAFSLSRMAGDRNSRPKP